MNRLPSLFRWLTLAALADWLITRTLTRAGVFIPKSPAWITAYQGAAVIGQGASTLAGLFALVTLGWVAWHEWQFKQNRGHSLMLIALALFSLLFLFVPAVGWQAIGAHLLRLAVISVLAWRGRTQPWIILPAVALGLGGMYQLLPVLFETFHLPGPPPLSQVIFNLGELFVVLSAYALWWAFGRHTSRGILFWAALPAFSVAGMFLAMPAMTGILSIWSTGLTLYLPWQLYTLGLWGIGMAVLTSLKERKPEGWAILLLAAGGYAPQLSTQYFFGLLALWMLVTCYEARVLARVINIPIPLKPIHATH